MEQNSRITLSTGELGSGGIWASRWKEASWPLGSRNTSAQNKGKEWQSGQWKDIDINFVGEAICTPLKKD